MLLDISYCLSKSLLIEVFYTVVAIDSPRISHLANFEAYEPTSRKHLVVLRCQALIDSSCFYNGDSKSGEAMLRNRPSFGLTTTSPLKPSPFTGKL
jgi:hypothetical protein